MAASVIETVECMEDVADKLLVELSLQELSKLAELLELSEEMIAVTNKRQMLRNIRKELERVALVAAGTDEALQDEDDDTRREREESFTKFEDMISAMKALMNGREDDGHTQADKEEEELAAKLLMMEESKQLTKEVEEMQQMLAEKEETTESYGSAEETRREVYP